MKNFTITQALQFSNDNTTIAFCKIKVGVVEIVLTFRENDSEVTMDQNEQLSLLQSAGMVFDFSEITESYKLMLENREEILKLQKIEKYKAEYHNKWYLKEDLPQIEGVEYDIEACSDFIERKLKRSYDSMRDLFVVYKGIKFRIEKTLVGGDRWSRRSGTVKYQIYDQITNYKRRNYSTVEKAVKKGIELVNEKKAADEAKENSEIKRKNEVQRRLALLNKVFGEAIHERSWKRGYNLKSQGYHVDEYWLVVNSKKLKIAFTKTEGVYNFAGLGELLDTQILQIKNII